MLIILLLLKQINCLPSPVTIEYDPSPPIVSVQARHVHIALGDQEESYSASWGTVNKTEESIVLVYSAGKELKYFGNSVLFVDGGAKKASQWIHKVTVTGLRGNMDYKYRVGSSLGWSDVFLLKTLPKGGHNGSNFSCKMSC